MLTPVLFSLLPLNTFLPRRFCFQGSQDVWPQSLDDGNSYIHTPEPQLLLRRLGETRREGEGAGAVKGCAGKAVPGEVCYPGTIAQNSCCVGMEAGTGLGRRQQAHSWSMLHGGVGFVLLAGGKQLEQVMGSIPCPGLWFRQATLLPPSPGPHV